MNFDPTGEQQRWRDPLVTRVKTEKNARGSPLYFSSVLVDYQSMARNASAIPLRTISAEVSAAQNGLFSDTGQDIPTANLSPEARTYLSRLDIANFDVDVDTASLLWTYALAIGYSPLYLFENADGIQRD